jgi:hypothetical protein
MQEAVETYIEFVEQTLRFSVTAQNELYKELLRKIAGGTWKFEDEFIEWKAQQAPPEVSR